MSNPISSATNYLKNNKVVLAIVVAAIVLTVGAIAYGQSNKSALQRKQLEADAKLASQIEDSKKANETREAKVVAEKKAAKVAAEKKAAEEKAAAEAAAKKAAEEAAAAQAAAAAAATTSISLSVGTPVDYGEKSIVPFSWSAGFTSEKGFKIVWSTSPYPTYPNDNYHYTGENNSGGSSEAKIYGSGTYYFRACEYLGNGTCSSNYSNQVVVNL